jgi:hypothetical protein
VDILTPFLGLVNSILNDVLQDKRQLRGSIDVKAHFNATTIDDLHAVETGIADPLDTGVIDTQNFLRNDILGDTDSENNFGHSGLSFW